MPTQDQEERTNFVKELLTNFTFAFGRGLQAASQARGRGQFAAGLGGALQAPFEQEAIDRQRAIQDLQMSLQQESARRAAEMHEFDLAGRRFDIARQQPGIDIGPAPVPQAAPIGGRPALGTQQQPGLTRFQAPTPFVDIPGLGPQQVTAPETLAAQERKATGLDLIQELTIRDRFAPAPKRNTVVVDGVLVDADTGDAIYGETKVDTKVIGDKLVNSSTGVVIADFSGPIPDNLKVINSQLVNVDTLEIVKDLRDLDKPDTRNILRKAIAARALVNAQKLKTHPGFTGAVGAKGFAFLFGAKSDPLPGTPEADFMASLEQLLAQITLPNLELMQGLGAMSDTELAQVRAAGTALRASQSESGFLKELQVIIDVMITADKKLGGKFEEF